MKFCGQVECVRRNKLFNFGEDTNLDPDLIIFLSDFSPLRDRAKLIYSTTSQKVVGRFGRNLVDRLGASQGRIDSIRVKIQIQIGIRELFIF